MGTHFWAWLLLLHTSAVPLLANEKTNRAREIEPVAARKMIDAVQQATTSAINRFCEIPCRCFETTNQRRQLKIVVTSTDKGWVGDEIPVLIHITNTFQETKDIRLKAVLSEGLDHPEGRDIEASLPNVAPGKEQIVTLRLHAAKSGLQRCILIADCKGVRRLITKAQMLISEPPILRVAQRTIVSGINLLAEIPGRLLAVNIPRPQLKLPLKNPEQLEMPDRPSGHTEAEKLFGIGR